MDEEFSLRIEEPIVVACVRCSGDARQMSQAFLEVADWLRQRELPSGPWIGVFHDVDESGAYVDPVTKQIRGEVWIPFAGAARGDGRVEVRELERHRVAAATHAGDIARIGETVRALKEWIHRQGLRPASLHRQVYLKAIPGAAADPGWRTEVQIPITE